MVTEFRFIDFWGLTLRSYILLAKSTYQVRVFTKEEPKQGHLRT